MTYVLLAAATFFMTMQQIVTKQYNIREKNPNLFLYTAVSCIAAMCFFSISADFKLNFIWDIIPYAVIFAIAYGMAIVGSAYAIKTGSLAISSLIMSYSLIIPTFYGIIFLNDSTGVKVYLGIALLLISLLLINMKKDTMKFTYTWVIFITIGFIGNGLCSTIQKIQQDSFGGEYKSEFMIVALFIASLALFLVGIFQNGSKREALKGCMKYASIYGVANGAVNLFIMMLTGMLSNAILFPTISGGGIIFTYIISRLFFKEKLSINQNIGFALGIISVILLNI